MDVKKYFDRLDLELPDPVIPDSELLRKLHFAHCTTVPYENVDMIRGIPTSLEEDALFKKIVEERKGGICFELNGALPFATYTMKRKLSFCRRIYGIAFAVIYFFGTRCA